MASTSSSGNPMQHAYRTGQVSQYLLLLACVAGVVGLLASRALVALCPVVGVLAALANPQLGQQLPFWLRNRSAWYLALLYLLLLISGFYTANWGFWRHELYRQLPLLGVPLAFALAKALSGRQRFGVATLFVVGLALLSTATLARYLRNPTEANILIGVGQNVPSVTHIFHIHFSIMLALAFYFGLLLRRSRYATPRWRGVLLGSSLLIVVALHVLAYRTGLLVFYVALLVDAAYLLVIQRRVRLGLALLVGLVVVPVAAYYSLESVHQRVKATRYDVEQFYYQHDINDFSLARRIAAWQTACTIASQNPLLGVGPADAEDAMMAQYKWHDFGLAPKNWVMIHNQYLHYLVSSGFVGLFIWFLVLLGPLRQPSQRRNPYVWHFLLIMGTAMLVDSLLEVQIGFNLFVFLYGFLVVATERHSQTRLTNPA